MKGKEHLRALPKIQIPTHYPRNSKSVALSLPIFASRKGRNALFNEKSGFDIESFKSLVCLSSVWAAVSIATNTDLCENGMPIYFHVEDVVMDIARPILAECGVPDDWIKETHFDPFPNEDIIDEACYGKKNAIFDDPSIDADVCIVWDTDAHIYRHPIDKVFKFYHRFEADLKNIPMFSFYSNWNGYENLFVNWLLLGAGQIERTFDQNDPANESNMKIAENDAYQAVGLSLPNQQHRWGSAILSLPRKHPLCDFISSHYRKAYADEALVSMYMNAHPDTPFLQLSHEFLQFIQDDSEFIDSQKSCIMHIPGRSAEDLPKYKQRMLRGIDGRTQSVEKLANYTIGKSSDNQKMRHNPKEGRVHILSVPHNPSHKDFSHCAFSQKARKLAYMADYAGWEAYHYGNELSEVECTEHVTVTTEADLVEDYGDFRSQTNLANWGSHQYVYKMFYLRAEHEIRKRFQPNDIICYVFGSGLRPLYDRLQDLQGAIHCESGIGYYRPYAPYRVYESPAGMHFNLGIAQGWYDHWDRLTDEQKKQRPLDPNTEIHHAWMQWYDAVIPNSFDLEDFEYSQTHDDYFLCLGRVMPGKGIEIAMRAAHALGKKLIVAGQGDFETNMGFKPWDNVEVVVGVDVDQRKELLANCKALFCLSTYPEPFGGVHIEAAMSGKPVISTDIGAYCHSVKHGLTGYRCRLNVFEQAVWAAQDIDTIDPATCRKWGQRFRNERVAMLYDEYFSSVIQASQNQKSPFWITNPGRTALGWIDDTLDWLDDPIIGEGIQTPVLVQALEVVQSSNT